MSKSSGSRTVPRAIIHKKILDAAAEQPGAPMEALASEVPSATTDLVERVLDEYGDPGAEDSEVTEPTISGGTTQPSLEGPSPDQSTTQGAADEPTISKEPAQTDDADPVPKEHMTEADTEVSTVSKEPPKPEPNVSSTAAEDTASDPDGPPESNDGTYPTVEELSDKQREVLRTIYEHPSSSQRELAEILDVSGSTVSNRANSIEGFSWDDRDQFATAVFENHTAINETENATMATHEINVQSELSQLGDRLESLEQKLEDHSQPERKGLCIEDSKFAQKIIHACLASEEISKEEELKLLESLID